MSRRSSFVRLAIHRRGFAHCSWVERLRCRKEKNNNYECMVRRGLRAYKSEWRKDQTTPDEGICRQSAERRVSEKEKTPRQKGDMSGDYLFMGQLFLSIS